MENIGIAKIFQEVAILLEIQGANVFRIRAYRAAAQTIESLGTPAASLVEQGPGRLEQLTGIGKDLAAKICEIVETGELRLLNELTRELPEGLVEMLRIPGLGPKRARQIYDALGVGTLDQLEQAARAGRLQALPGFKATLEKRILKGIADLKRHAGRFLLAEAGAYVGPILETLRAARGVRRLEVAGSFRRRRETVGDLDILVAADHGMAAIAEGFVEHPAVTDVLARGDTRCSVRLAAGLQVDLRIVPLASYGAALHYFTGSKGHNIAIRTRGVKRRLKVNEYGVFRGTRRVGGRREEDVFKAVGLPWIPPEIRENTGEIEAAERDALPHLVQVDDIRGDLQMHTTYTDGLNTLAEMVEACRAKGYAYMAVTDHTQAVRVAGGLNRSAFRKQFREIDRLQRRVSDLRILKSAEVDILGDGQLDLDDATLAELDVVLVSVHSRFNLPKPEMTRRVVRALQHPRVNVLGHPTGRLLGRREPYALDMEEVVKVAANEGVLLEINAQPDRLDLSDSHARLARDAGVKLVVSTDAHRTQELDHMDYGVHQARRAWCEPSDVANTRSWPEFRKLIAR